MNCAIIGATGYTGVELTKILLRHSYVRLTHLTTRQAKPVPVRSLIPSVSKNCKLVIKNYALEELKKKVDIFFVCLPHTEAMITVAKLRKAGKIVIDLSADYRLKKVLDYKKWYELNHKYPALLRQSVYGLCELNRSRIVRSDLIANPGCYPTGALLGIAPLLKNKLIDAKSIVIDSKSGASGAGKKLTVATHFSELTENFFAYRVNRHQHSPEMLQEMEGMAKGKVNFTFVPHLLPVHRGILSVIYATLKKRAGTSQVLKAYQNQYDGETFVRLKKAGEFPSLKDVQHTNFCDVGIEVDKKSNRVIVITAIDNLIKGASGQAVQNMNIRLGFPEEEGLLL